MVGKIAWWRIAISLLLLLLQLILISSAFAQPPILTADEAFQLRATRTAPDVIRLKWTMRVGYYLYRDKIAAVGGESAERLPITTPQGIVKDDPSFGATEIYLDHAEATLSGPQVEAEAARSVTISYQGCQDRGICYPPVTKRLDLSSMAFADSKSVQPGESAGSDGLQSLIGEDAAAPIVLADDGGGLVSSLLADGGVTLLLASFLVFGIALAFTPCVFPMYPILAAVLTRSVEKLSPRRSFVLSGIYVLSMASAFALLGLTAAWSGRNLQIAFQSPAAVIVISVLFVALALSMFGLYELQLPARWVTAISGRKTPARGSMRSAAVLGFTSALIMGPCVTAPLAGALLYVAQTGDAVLGAAALFTLGIGKGVPLIVFGTLGAQAMPKAGSWMAAVKQAFGLVFLATAVWLISRILPGPYSLALWALLLIGVGVYLGAFDPLTADSSARTRAAKVSGLVASVYGILLAIGAASGSADPLQPLGLLAQRAAPAAAASFTPTRDSEALARRLADAEGRPSLVYFTADWCLACTIIERSVLPEPAVRQHLTNFNLIKIDVTDNGPEQQRMMQSLRVAGPPTMIFVDPAAREIAGTRLVGDVTTRSLLAAAAKIAGK